jgi:hypothetical protein
MAAILVVPMSRPTITGCSFGNAEFGVKPAGWRSFEFMVIRFQVSFLMYVFGVLTGSWFFSE